MYRRWDERGLSLVEVLVAVTILAVTLTPLIGLFATSRMGVEDITRRTEALALARSALDEMVARDVWTEIESEGPDPHPLNAAFTVTVTVDQSRNDYLKDVVARVEWTAGGDVRWVELYSAVYKRRDPP